MERLPGSLAPELTLELLGGGTANIPAPGEPQLLFFFKLDCPTCPLAARAVERAHRVYGADGLTVLGISQDPPGPTRAWLEANGMTIQTAVEEPSWPASEAFSLHTVPTVVLIDARGRVAAVQEGWSRLGFEHLSQRMAELSGLDYQPLSDEGAPAYQPG